MNPNNKHRPKASDIDDLEFLKAVKTLSLDGKWAPTNYESRWVMWPELCPLYPDMPAKVILAKFRQLHKRGLLDGCPCGCRGDIEFTEAGEDFIKPREFLNEKRRRT